MLAAMLDPDLGDEADEADASRLADTLPGAPADDEADAEYAGEYLAEPGWQIDPDALRPEPGEAVCEIHHLVYWVAAGRSAFCCL